MRTRTEAQEEAIQIGLWKSSLPLGYNLVLAPNLEPLLYLGGNTFEKKEKKEEERRGGNSGGGDSRCHLTLTLTLTLNPGGGDSRCHRRGNTTPTPASGGLV